MTDVHVADVCWSRPGLCGPDGGRWGAWPEPPARVGELALFLAPDASSWRGLPWRACAEDAWQAWQWGGGAPRAADVRRWLDDPRTYDPAGRRVVLVVLDQRTQALHVWTDRFGTIALYHAPGCVTSTYRAALAASARVLDWEGIATFLGLGFFLDDRTWHTDVRQLAAGSHHVFDASLTLQRSTRWAHWEHEPDTARDEAATLDALDAALAESTADVQGRDGLALPLSGGLDSRTLLGLLAPRGGEAPPPWCFGYGYQPDSIETRIGGQLAAARDVAFDSFVVPTYLWNAMDRVMGATEGFVDVTQPRQAFMASTVASHGDRVVGGHWGDVWFDDLGLLDAEGDVARLEQEALRRLRKQGRAWLLEHVVAPALGEDPEAHLRERLRASLRPYADIADLDFRLKAFKTDTWSHRWTLPSLQTYRLGAQPVLPFYAESFYAFMRTVPSARVAGRALQKAWLCARHPDLARVPWQATGHDLFHDAVPGPAPLPVRALRKLLRLARGEKILERNWEVQFGGKANMDELRQRLLDPASPLRDHVATAPVEELLRAFERSPLEDKRGYTVCMLLTMHEALRHHGA